MKLKSTNIWDDVRANRGTKPACDPSHYQGRFAHGHISQSYAERDASTDDCRAATYDPRRTSRRSKRKAR